MNGTVPVTMLEANFVIGNKTVLVPALLDLTC